MEMEMEKLAEHKKSEKHHHDEPKCLRQLIVQLGQGGRINRVSERSTHLGLRLSVW